MSVRGWCRRLHDEGYLVAFAAVAVAGEFVGAVLALARVHAGVSAGTLTWPLTLAVSAATCWWVLRACGFAAAGPTAGWYVLLALGLRAATRSLGAALLSGPLTAVAPLAARALVLRLWGDAPEASPTHPGPMRTLHERGYFVAVAGAALVGPLVSLLLTAVAVAGLSGGNLLVAGLVVVVALGSTSLGAAVIGCWLALQLCGFARAKQTALWLIPIYVGGGVATFVSAVDPTVPLVAGPVAARALALVGTSRRASAATEHTPS